ncbi:pectinesterase [Colletotrichum salicis]|uniref:pectinesterase n=1 Tax=Colletotrichum salicis TaxID=1209931 RepID=A0A135V1F0_9PEZI|nr:pectinesterase [Colletotrichum salicis]
MGARLALAGACLVVSKSPGEGQYNSVQLAINALSTTSEGSQCVFISRGEYVENIRVDERKAQLSIFGENVNGDRQAAKPFADNLVTLRANNTPGNRGSAEETPALYVKARDFRLYNVNVVNPSDSSKAATALRAESDSGYYGCQITGGRRALVADAGHQLYAGCLIKGDKDIISGDKATAWFERSHIALSNADPGYVTANGRQSPKDRSIFVFNACSIASDPGAGTKPGTYYLGRPKGAYAQVVFQKTDMSDAINPKGWAVWKQSDPRTDHVLFGEYRNKGLGAEGNRARFSRRLNESVTITSILGKGYKKAEYYDGLFVSRSLAPSPSLPPSVPFV